jgi:hypothetical protein
MCVASRPWLPFEDAFKQGPSLLLQWLTEKDIVTYVTTHFHQNEHYIRLEACEPAQSRTLIPQIVEKASSVFLWVYLVVQSLLDGLSNGNRASDLQTRLDALPADLGALFDVILARLIPRSSSSPDYYRQACETFRLVRSYRKAPRHMSNSGCLPTLLALYFADDPDTDSSVQAPCTQLDTTEIRQKVEQMRCRVKARSGGLLEAHPFPIRTHNNEGDWFGGLKDSRSHDHNVSYLHRTARDYMESDAVWPTVLEASSYDAFPCDERWANAHLWLHKTSPMPRMSQIKAREAEERCLDMAIKSQKRTGILPWAYLAEVLKATAQRCGVTDMGRYGRIHGGDTTVDTVGRIIAHGCKHG